MVMQLNIYKSASSDIYSALAYVMLNVITNEFLNQLAKQSTVC